MGKGYGDMADKPRCRIWLDLMVCYRKLSTQEMESYSLEYISRKELGAGKIEHEERFQDFWRNNLDKFIEYNIKDVYLMVKIEESKGQIFRHDQTLYFLQLV
jgi:DNA polymerase elongation subunit (family B)